MVLSPAQAILSVPPLPVSVPVKDRRKPARDQQTGVLQLILRAAAATPAVPPSADGGGGRCSGGGGYQGLAAPSLEMSVLRRDIAKHLRDDRETCEGDPICD